MISVVILFALVGIISGQNPDCAVLLPAQPLTPAGLAVPYLMSALNAANGPCNQANPDQTAFVQGVIYDNSVIPVQLLVYNPIVVDAADPVPAVALVAPVLNPGSIVGLWFGVNGNTLTLLDGGKGGFAAGSCVNGLVTGPGQTSIFGQFAYCNAANFFAVTFSDMRQGLLVPPPLGTAIDGMPCPTTLDFFVVDHDPADNVVTTYLIVKATGRVALNTTENLQRLGGNNVNFAVNPSDERLVIAIGNAIGCKSWFVRDLNDNFNFAGVGSYGANEIFAAYHQLRTPGLSPPGYIPLNDPMARIGVQVSLPKVNAYRAGCGHPMAVTPRDADVTAFCRNMLIYQPSRMLKNINALYNAPSPTPAVATSLLGFLANRFVSAFGLANLGCTSLLQVPNPINLTVNGAGQVTGAVIMPWVVPVPVVSQPAYVRGSAAGLQFNFFLAVFLVLLAFARM